MHPVMSPNQSTLSLLNSNKESLPKKKPFNEEKMEETSGGTSAEESLFQDRQTGNRCCVYGIDQETKIRLWKYSMTKLYIIKLHDSLVD